MPEEMKESKVEERLVSVETVVAHLQTDITEVKSSIEKGFQILHVKLEKQQDAAKPAVAKWASWAGVLLLVVSMIGTGYIRDLNRVEADTIYMDSRLRDLEKVAEHISFNAQRIQENKLLVETNIRYHFKER